ncbi:hypothetical protein CK203_010106 [Vitis vinifera]|uniref:Uncharacterized protein n=1 Tax=Vitis vinifera TaxID=29760 RepID=A0A438JXP8_VITVI|nr:hypothetical protein CK203_010106 [Vitis vinifera]
MKVLFGSPGRLSGLVLRMGQCSFAASSIGIMLSASGYSASTAFWKLGPSKFKFDTYCSDYDYSIGEGLVPRPQVDHF